MFWELQLTTKSYLKDIDIPGDKLQYGDFSLRFLVDEELENYMAIHNWLTGLGFPEVTQQNIQISLQIIKIIKEILMKHLVMDALHILNSNYRDVAIVKFSDMFPTSLTSLEFEATDTDVNYFTAEVNFKYTLYTILVEQTEEHPYES